MTRCEHYQSLLLDHLYGLLEAEEGLALIEHAGGCETCRAALQQADLQKQLLGAAAKAEFSGVRFEEPDPQRLAAPARKPRLGRPIAWQRWAVAAGIVLALTAIGLPVGRYAAGFAGAQKDLKVAKADLDGVIKQQRDLIAERDAQIKEAVRAYKAAELLKEQLVKQQENEVKAAADRIFAQDLEVVVTGPATLRLDEPTTYVIETRKLNTNTPAPAKLDVVVRDETTNQVVYQKKDIKSGGRHQLVLGPEVAVKGGAGLALELGASSEGGARGEVREKLALARATFVTHVATDKPMYQPGETVHWRSLTLDRFTLRPATDDITLVYTMFGPQGNQIFQLAHAPRLLGPDGREVLGPDRKAVRGVGTGDWVIPEGFPGGEYVLEVREVRERFPTERRKFVVNQYQKHRLLKDVKFDKESYGPGAEVVANLEVKKAEGGPAPAFMPVSAIVRIDGAVYTAAGQKANDEDAAKIRAKTDDEGKAVVKFKLPANIAKGEATLGLEFTDGANFEPLSRPIPVVVNRLQLELFPEGGDLVAGVPNRVYFQARTMLDKPAAVNKAQVVDDAGAVVVDNIRTLNDPKEPGINQGNGRFGFTPAAGRKYSLKVLEPAGITQTYPLPDVLTDGVGLAVPSGVTAEGQPIQAAVYSVGKDRELLVGVYCRGRLLNYQELTAHAGQKTELNLKPARDIGGVYRVTVFEKRTAPAGGLLLKPLAERLVYREPAERLKLAATPDKSRYTPGEYVRLALQADTEAGKPAPAMLLVGVVDKSVIKMADERTARAMPTHFLLTSEVRRPEDLEFTDVLLGDHALAREALDMLLGTQGWRRFLESEPTRFRDQKQQKIFEDMKCKADADRLFVALGKMKIDQNLAFNTYDLHYKQIVAKYRPKFEDMQAQLVQADEQLAALQDGKEFDARKRDLDDSANSARLALGTAATTLRDYEDFHAVLRSRALLLFGIILVVAGAGSLVIAVTRSLPRALPFYGSAVAAVAVCGLVVLGTFFFDVQMPDSAMVALAPRPAGDRAGEEAATAAPGGFFQEPHPANAPLPDRLADKPAEGADAAGVVRKADGDREKRDQFRGAFGGAPAADGKPVNKGVPVPEGKAGDGKGGGAGLANQAPGQQAGQGAAPRAALMLEQQRREAGKEQKDKDAALLGAVPAPGMAGRPQAPAAKMPGAGPGRAPNAPPVAIGAAAAPQKPGDVKQFAARPGPVPAPMAPVPPADPQFKRGERAEMDQVNRLRDDRADERAAALAAPEANGVYRQNALQDRALQLNADALKKNLKEADRAKGEHALNALEKARRNLAEAEQVAAAPCWVRQYAHQRHGGPDPDLRWDFTETLFWHPVVVLPNGKGEVEFQLCDSVTSFQVVVLGHTADGRLGSFTGDFESKKLFNLSAALPLEVTANDAIDVPVAIENATDDQRTVSVALELQGLVLVPGTASNAERKMELKPRERGRTIFRVQPTIKDGTALVKLKGHTEPFGSDAALYTIKVVPEGFPAVDQVSDVLEKSAQHEVVLPDQLIKGTLKASLAVYPSTLADLQKGLEGLLREPHGCFEQTSTTNYPNVLILSYLMESNQANPELEQRARALLERGYGRLISFECLNQGKQLREGYEWFGGAAPAHEALTAYGLLQFRDMQRVGYPVDNQMIERTKKYLLSRRDGKGGFLRNARALDTFGRAPDDITNAYIVWAITESEGKDGPPENLEAEITALANLAQDSKDPYFLSLVANVLLNRSMTDKGLEICRKLTTLQKPEGFLDGARTSITGSGGRTLQIETTALAVLAWTKANLPQEFHKNLSPAIKWIGQQRGGQGAFGSTQSTILALRALLAYAKGNRKPMPAGELVLKIGDTEVARKPFGADLRETLTLEVPEAEKHLKPGKNLVKIELVAQGQAGLLPYTFSWNYQALKPVSAEQTPIRMAAKISKAAAQDGEPVGMRVTVENTAQKGHGMVVAVVGIPAGLNLPENFEQLRNHARLRNNGTEAGTISAFEVKGRELVLYWRQMAPGQKIDVDIDLVCRVPGEYRGPASRAYLYYNADHKHWIEPVVMKVEPKP